MKFSLQEVEGDVVLRYQSQPKGESRPKLSAPQIELGNRILAELATEIEKQGIGQVDTLTHDANPAVKFLATRPEDLSQMVQLNELYTERLERYEPQRRWFTVGHDETKSPSVCVDMDNTDKAACKMVLSMPEQTHDILLGKDRKAVAAEWFRDDYSEAGPAIDAKKETHISRHSVAKREANWPVLSQIADDLRRDRKKVTVWPVADKPATVSFNVPYDRVAETLQYLEKTVASVTLRTAPERG